MQSRELSRQSKQQKQSESNRDSSMDSQIFANPSSKDNKNRDMSITQNSVQGKERGLNKSTPLNQVQYQEFFEEVQIDKSSSLERKKISREEDHSCDSCQKPDLRNGQNNFTFSKEVMFQHSQTHNSKDSEAHEEESKQSVRHGKKYNFPKEATSILKKWLIEHVEHPYLKNNDKIQLSKDTGLTRKQVQNWFTNVRKRIWQPLMSKFKNKKDLKKIILKLKLKLDSSSSDEDGSQFECSSSRHDSVENIKDDAKNSNASPQNESLMQRQKKFIFLRDRLQVGMKRLQRQFDSSNNFAQYESHIQNVFINPKRVHQRKSKEHSEDTKVKQYLQQMDQFNKQHQQLREADHVSSNIASGDNKSGGSNDSNIAYFESSTNGMRNQNQTGNLVNGSSGSGNSNGNQVQNIPVVVMCCPNLVKGEPCFCGHSNMVPLSSNVQLHQFLNNMMGVQTSSTGSSSKQKNGNGSSGPFSAQYNQQGEFFYLDDDSFDIAGLPNQPCMSWITGSSSFQTMPNSGLTDNISNTLGLGGGQPISTTPENLLINNNAPMIGTTLSESQIQEKIEEVQNHVKSIFTLLGQNQAPQGSAQNVSFNQMYYLMTLQNLLGQLFHQLLFFQQPNQMLTKTQVQQLPHQYSNQSYPNYFQQQSNMSSQMPPYHHPTYSSSSSSGGSNLIKLKEDKKKQQQSYENIYFPNVHLPRPPNSNLGSSSNQSKVSK